MYQYSEEPHVCVSRARYFPMPQYDRLSCLMDYLTFWGWGFGAISGMTKCHVDNFGEVLITFLLLLTNCHVFGLFIWIFFRNFRVAVGGSLERVVHRRENK